MDTNIMNYILDSIMDIPFINVLAGGVILTGGLALSFTIVSYVMYDKNNKYNPKMDDIGSVKEAKAEYKIKARELKVKRIKYGQQFYDKLEALEDKDLSNQELMDLRNKTVEEKNTGRCYIDVL